MFRRARFPKATRGALPQPLKIIPFAAFPGGDGDLKITMIDEGAFTLTWATAEESASLTVDLPTNKFSILHRTAAGDEQIF